MQIKFQAQMKHEEDNSDLAPGMNALCINNCREQRKIRAYQKARQDIAQYQWLFNSFEYDCDDSCRQHHARKIGDKSWNMHTASQS